MNIIESHRLFRVLIDKVDALNQPNFLSEEIDMFLNLGQDSFVKQRYGKNNLKRESFEETEKRRRDLGNIVKESFRSSLPPELDNYNFFSYEVVPEEDEWFTIYERAILNCPTCNTSIRYKTYSLSRDSSIVDESIQGVYADIEAITHLELNNILTDPFRRPSLFEGKINVYRLIEDSKIQLIVPPECTLLHYTYRYIKKPIRVSLGGSIDFELADHTHEEIVKLAVQIALEDIEAKRQQTFNKTVNETE